MKVTVNERHVGGAVKMGPHRDPGCEGCTKTDCVMWGTEPHHFATPESDGTYSCHSSKESA